MSLASGAEKPCGREGEGNVGQPSHSARRAEGAAVVRTASESASPGGFRNWPKAAFRNEPSPASKSSGRTLSLHGGVRRDLEKPLCRDLDPGMPHVTHGFRSRGLSLTPSMEDSGGGSDSGIEQTHHPSLLVRR